MIEFGKSKLVTHGSVTVEKNCCMTMENKKFCAIGAVIEEERIFAYLNKKNEVTTWSGEVLSTKVRILEKCFNPFDIYHMNEGFYLRFLYKGKVFSGVSPNGCYLKARVTKLKSIWSD